MSAEAYVERDSARLRVDEGQGERVARGPKGADRVG
jgi:hypothetical protein